LMLTWAGWRVNQSKGYGPGSTLGLATPPERRADVTRSLLSRSPRKSGGNDQWRSTLGLAGARSARLHADAARRDNRLGRSFHGRLAQLRPLRSAGRARLPGR